MRIGRWETEILGETLLQCHYVHHKSHINWPGIEPGPWSWEAWVIARPTSISIKRYNPFTSTFTSRKEIVWRDTLSLQSAIANASVNLPDKAAWSCSMGNWAVLCKRMPITVPVRVLRREMSSLARTLGSCVRFPLKAWMFICVYSVCVVLCVGGGLATGWSPVQGGLRCDSRMLYAPSWEQQVERQAENKCMRMRYCKHVGYENIGQQHVVSLCLREICKRRWFLKHRRMNKCWMVSTAVHFSCNVKNRRHDKTPLCTPRHNL
jgi:hypothetical protein